MREMRSLLFAFRFPGRRGGGTSSFPETFLLLLLHHHHFCGGKIRNRREGGLSLSLSFSLSLHLCLPLYGPEIEREGKFRDAEAKSYQGLLDGRMVVG